MKSKKSSNENGIGIVDSAWVSKQDTQGELWRYDPVSKMISKVTVALNENGRVVGGLIGGDLIVEAGVDALVDGQQVKAWTREGGI